MPDWPVGVPQRDVATAGRRRSRQSHRRRCARVDGYRLCDLLAEYELGVRRKEGFEVLAEFFADV